MKLLTWIVNKIRSIDMAVVLGCMTGWILGEIVCKILF